MSNSTEQLDLSLENLSTKEFLNPKNLPEIAFQSYEKLENDGLEHMEDFINEDIYTPTFDYVHFKDTSDLEQSILTLKKAKETIDNSAERPEVKSPINATLDYRLTEYFYVKKLAELDQKVKSKHDNDTENLKKEIKILNKELYGEAEPEIVEAVINTVRKNIDSKQLSESAKSIYDELLHGFDFQGEHINGLPEVTDENLMLPELNKETLYWLGKNIAEQNPEIMALVDELWHQKQQEFGEEYECPPEDIKELFDQAIAFDDPNGQSGVKVVLREGSSFASWNSNILSVVIGSKRKAIKKVDQLKGLLAHEYLVHGRRAVNGFKTELPVLGSGLYTDTARSDYLTFEEGFATLVQESLKNDITPIKWKATNIGHYLNIALAERGHDFREVFELAWRYRVLMSVKDNQEVSQDLIKKHQIASYQACIRIFRGNQTGIGDNITYNKDLAYMKGKIIAIDYLKELADNNDLEGLNKLFLAKYDPTIPEQAKLVEEFAVKQM